MNLRSHCWVVDNLIAPPVVEVVPGSVKSIPHMQRVMSVANVANMVRYCVQVVQWVYSAIVPTAPLCRLVQVPIVQRVSHRPVDLRPPARVRADLETLQVDDEYGREHEEVDLLRGIDVRPAPGAVPPLVPRQEFLRAKNVQAVIEGVASVGYRERQVHEGIEFHAHVPAAVLPVIVIVVARRRRRPSSSVPTGHRVPQLALEQVHDDALIPREVSGPHRNRVAVVVRPVALVVLVGRVVRRPDPHAIEILVHPVEEVRQELVHVVLAMPSDLRGEPSFCRNLSRSRNTRPEEEGL